jgi:hypothetical protein
VDETDKQNWEADAYKPLLLELHGEKHSTHPADEGTILE